MYPILQFGLGQWGGVLSEVTIVGSINIDLTSYLERWPQVGETVLAKETLISLGGKGANQAVAASRIGAKATIVGAIGADTFGTDVEQRLRNYNVATQLSLQRTCATGMAFIDVGPDGGNIIRVSSGANAALDSRIIEEHSRVIANSKIVLLQNEIPLEASIRAAQIAKLSGTMVVMDPAPAPVPFWPLDALQFFDILTPNASETKMITGHEPSSLSEGEDAARKLHEYGVRGSIITMGAIGVAWSIDGKTGSTEAPKVNSVDTVAAGDCFNGAFAAAQASGQSIAASIDIAVNAAALATTRNGAAESIPTLEELRSVMPVS